MSTPFLIGFSRAIVERLLAEDLLEVTAGREDHVAAFVADRLAGGARPMQLVESLVRALVECPDVLELYADDAEVGLQIEALHGRS